MPINILMPALSPTMTEGTLAKWLVKEGDEVSSGDVIAEIETDKATMEVESIDDGTVGKLLVSEGTDGVPVNKVIAVLLEEGEDASAIPSDPQGDAPAPKAAEAKQEAAPKEEKAEKPAASGNGAEPPAKAAPAQSAGAGERLFASPLARRRPGCGL
jgi:pyruvate dehydrogenase E2 component (dihydrolipoamide acetyltransferase)